jgi:hypothetical protein
MTITTASLLGSAIFLLASYSREEMKHNQEAALERIRAKYGDNLDVVRGLFIVTCSPFIVAYFMLSALNQVVRKVGINPCARPSREINAPDQVAGVFTLRAEKQLIRMRSWNLTQVFTYAIYW